MFLTGQEEIESAVKSIKDIAQDLSQGVCGYVLLFHLAGVQWTYRGLFLWAYQQMQLCFNNFLNAYCSM